MLYDFLWTEGVQGAEIHTHLCAQYGDNSLEEPGRTS